MRKQIIKILQQKPQSKQKQSSCSKNNFKGELFLSNHLQDDKVRHNSYQTNDQLGIHFLNCSKGIGSKEPKHLLQKLKAVQRISLASLQQSEMVESKIIGKDHHSQNIGLEQKQKEEKDNSKSSQSKAQKIDFLKKMLQSMKEQTQKQQTQLKAYQVENQLLKKQLGASHKQKDVLKQKIKRLQDENAQLKYQLLNNSMKINQIKAQHRESEQFSLRKLIQLQQYIENLKAQNEETLRKAQNQAKTKDKQTEIKGQLQLYSSTLKVVVFAAQNKEKDSKQKECKDLQLNFLQFEKKYIVIINKLKKDHEQQISNLKKTFYENLNFYRQLIKKSGNHLSSDTLKKPEQSLENGFSLGKQMETACFNPNRAGQQAKIE